MRGLALIGRDGRLALADSGFANAADLPGNLIGKPWAEALHPDDRALADAAYSDMIATGAGELKSRVPQGPAACERILVLVRCPDGAAGGAYCVVCDITEARAWRKELIRQNVIGALQAVSTCTPHARDGGSRDAVLTIDENGTIIFANDAAEAVFGCAAGEMLGTNVTTLMEADLRALHQAKLSRYVATGERSLAWDGIKTTGLHKSGKSIPVEVSLAESTVDGRRLVTGIVRDVTESRRVAALAAAQNAISLLFAESKQEAQLLREVVRELCQALDCELGQAWLSGTAPGTLQPDGEWHTPGPGLDELAVLQQGLELEVEPGAFDPSWRDCRSGQGAGAIARIDAARREALVRAGIHGIVALPITSRGEILAVFELFGTADRAPAGPVLETLRHTCRQIGVQLDRWQANQALRESESRYRRLVECSPDAVIVHSSERISFVNEAARKLFGADRAELLLGRSVLDLVHPDCRALACDRLERLRAGEEVPRIEERFLRLDGSTVEVEVASIAFSYRGRLAVQSTVRDVTSRKIAERELRESEERYKLLVNGVKDHASIMLDPGGRVSSWNMGAERVFGYSGEEILQRDFGRFYPAGENAESEPARALKVAVEQGMHPVQELWCVRKDGARFWAEVAITALRDEDGRLRGFSYIVRDIGERKRADEELAAQMREIERSNAELEQFAFFASHDLQEPLRKVQTFGDRLRSKFGECLTGEGLDYLERMQSAAHRMHVLIDNLLLYSRVTTKGQPFAAVDLRQVAQDVIADLEVQIETVHGTVVVEDLPTVHADAMQIRQLFQNLIGNALKFHKPEVPPVVKVRGRLAGGCCTITVEDNGVGFDPKHRERIFAIFQRLHSRSEFEGTGIGLAICRKIVERHGGTITADSTPGNGARFEIALPRKIAAARREETCKPKNREHCSASRMTPTTVS